MVDATALSPDPTAEFNLTDRDFPDQATLPALIEARVRERPRQTALLCDHDACWGASSLTYEQLNEKANQLARLLRERGVGPGQVVGILVERSFALIIGIFGILKAGGAYLPLSPADPAERIKFVLEDAGVRLVLVHAATVGKAPGGVPLLDLERPEVYFGPTNDLAPAAGPTDLAYVIYTSGSTGRPKGVMVEHRAVVNRLHWMQEAYPLDRADVLLQKTPTCFDVSVWELFWWAISGASLCLLAPRGERSLPALLEAVRRHRVSVLHFVPSMLSVFLESLEGRPDKVTGFLPSLRRVFASGEALAPAHVRKFYATIGAATGCRLTNLYGPTEAAVDATCFDCPPGLELDRIPIGRPIQNMRAYIVREGWPVPLGEPGELCLAGVGLARGYVNNPALTRERFGELPGLPGERVYRTGDVARWLPDGNLEYLGREDHQVKIRGLRIELGEIENLLREFPAIADCVVVTQACSETIVLLVAYLVPKAPVDRPALRRHLQRHLPDYMIPAHFQEMAALPLTATGKVDRAALPPTLVGPKASSS